MRREPAHQPPSRLRGHRLRTLHRSSSQADVAAALADLGVPFERHGEDVFLVTMPGEHGSRTLAWVILGV